LFEDGWEDVPVSDVAEAAGVANQTVINLFGGVQGVAAATFSRHTATIRSVAAGTRELAPGPSLELVLTRLAECVRIDPEPARALLAERIATSLHQGGELSDMDIRLEVPLADSVVTALSRMVLEPFEIIDIASMLINFVLVQSLSGSSDEAAIAAMAMRLLPDSRLLSP